MEESAGAPGPDGAVAVLLYHEVAAEPLARGFRRFAVSPSQLEEHLSALVGAGYELESLAGVLAPTPRAAPPVTPGAPGRPGARRRVVLTFDDAFASIATDVLGLLGRYRAAATLYVPTAFVGGRAAWLSPVGEGDRPLASWADLADARDAGIELGAHGHRHVELDTLGPGELAGELLTSRRLLEERLGVTVRTVAYPFGYHDGATRAAARRLGYESACEVGYGLWRPGSDPFALRRLLVQAGTGPEALLSAVAEGRTSATERLRRATRPAWRAYRRRRTTRSGS